MNSNLLENYSRSAVRAPISGVRWTIFLSRMQERNPFSRRNCWRVIVRLKLHPVARRRSMKPCVYPTLNYLRWKCIMQRTRTHHRLCVWLFNRALILCPPRSLSSGAIWFRETAHKCLLTLNILIVGDSRPLSLLLPDTVTVVYIRPLRQNVHPSSIYYTSY